ncbi:MAG: ribonuclease HII [Deltaproteobacteria bacterium]|jgi:ribonuclease HII|nr:ribonuclease HII [Deltaproteobacteria bacterium]MCK5008933.1 ribonuclease HII [Deltaproteobacteria bacterium]MCK5185904.1 ribonuclease HII [Deltaproteobacteria bacterium]MCK5422360.1 ribonuclease HII [Deltaproteobacteria bacterium]NOQ86915.1 ribonuclease HII [Deltaproteobacteria bacterium]
MNNGYPDKPHGFLLPEYSLYKKEYRYIAGIDEVGRGPLAGPVMAAAVVLPPYCELPGIDDSKKLTPLKREKLYVDIFEAALSVGIGRVDQVEIDKINILNASLKAMAIALNNLSCPVEYVLVDGIFPVATDISQMTLKKGDSKSVLIAAASVVAKVTRDKIMEEYHDQYPCYNFARNKGYGTREHLDALKKYGCSPLHRKTFRGVTEDVLKSV